LIKSRTKIVALPHSGVAKKSTPVNFQHFRSDRIIASDGTFAALTRATDFGMGFALQQGAALQMYCEAVMWKITTRGFTLQEVLILAAMNIAAGTDSGRKMRATGVAEKKEMHAIKISNQARRDSSR
jgi:hypothetical protein